MIFGFVNIKGGVGKSKLNGYFATYGAAKKGKKVLLIDTDVSQQTTKEFDADIPDGMELEVLEYEVKYGNLDSMIKSVESAYDLIVVDFPGNIQQEGIIRAMATLDYAIIPTTPEPEDVGASQRTMEILDQLELPYNVLMNNYEAQYYGMGESERNGFKEFNEEHIFNGKLLPVGIRKERSLLNQNFVLGQYGGHKNTKRVEEALDLIYSNLESNG